MNNFLSRSVASLSSINRLCPKSALDIMAVSIKAPYNLIFVKSVPSNIALLRIALSKSISSIIANSEKFTIPKFAPEKSAFLKITLLKFVLP